MMYIVRFLDKYHDVDSEYTYSSFTDAMKHLDAFRDDTSNLYSNISILDAEKNLIIDIILFDKSGKMKAEFKDGSIVKFKKEWQNSPAEDADRYVITNIHEEQESCLAKYIDVDHKYAFGSSQNLSLDWIEVVKL